MTQPHPQRCETCMDINCEYHDKPNTLANFAKPFFEKKGCASHISPIAYPHQLLERYIRTLNNYYVDFADGTIVIYRNKNNKNDQIKIPRHPEYSDYEELIIRAIASLVDCASRTHAPAPDRCFIGLTSEQCEECSTREKQNARKDERKQVLDALEEFLNSDDHLSLFKWEVREQIRSLRCGATDEGGERR